MTPPKMKIKKGDFVVVIAGKDKGKRGKVIRSLPREQRVVVEGVNLVKKHTRPSGRNKGGIITVEAPIHVSNVMLLCPQCQSATRVGYRFLDDGRKVRVCKKCGEIIDEV